MTVLTCCRRNADTLGKLQTAEKALKAQEEAAYQDPEKAVAEKEAGNEAFKAQKCADLQPL